MDVIRFKFRPDKAKAAIEWMLQQYGQLDLHTVLKACYFADKAHLNQHFKPIFGAQYRAMRFGPVPLEIYEMAKGESLWLSEIGEDNLPWHLNGYRLNRTGDNRVDTSALSEENLRHLKDGIELSNSLTFNERTALTHGKDWQAADLGMMRYEDMIEDRADKADLIAFLKETSKHTKL